MKEKIRMAIHRLLHSRWVLFWIPVLSALENTILLIVIEPLFIPVMAARRYSAFLIAALLVLGCVAGAVATYFAAYYAYEPLIEPALRAVNLAESFAAISEDIEQRGFWALFLVGVPPVPFQLGTVASGVLKLPLADFIAAVALSRSLRYFGLALLVHIVGRRAERLVQRYEAEFALACLVVFVGMALVVPLF